MQAAGVLNNLTCELIPVVVASIHSGGTPTEVMSEVEGRREALEPVTSAIQEFLQGSVVGMLLQGEAAVGKTLALWRVVRACIRRWAVFLEDVREGTGALPTFVVDVCRLQASELHGLVPNILRVRPSL